MTPRGPSPGSGRTRRPPAGTRRRPRGGNTSQPAALAISGWASILPSCGVTLAPDRARIRPSITTRSSPLRPARTIRRLPGWPGPRRTSLVVRLRDLLGTLNHEHGPGQDARIGRRAVAGIGEAPVLRQAL